MIIVSTDGSCLRNPGGAIGWAWVNHQGSSASAGAASGTNQVAELRAVLEAIRAHPGPEPLFIESDSLYAIKCASEWLPSWRLNGWRTATGSAVKNVELVQWIDHAIATRPGPVRFRWVRGHVGNYYNEQADKLAGEAARAAAGRADATPNGIDDLPPLPTAVRPPAAVTETMSDTAATTPLTVVVTDKPASRPKRGRATAETADALTLF
ncbi:ribonuclease HI [Nocardia sp. 852002-20019_SCH5090214]|jgi:ribonuclease HI|uniref:ribonuclease H n=1 Tax=Nocardia nova TaxID=37330 RepID=A0A2S6AEY8_9NOCA|nr:MULTISPECIES: ribonuclease H [Nocardia]OBF68378.1 ribonuclease HI [Mycobacterium sp. 852002-51759_SCH5129042]MBF6272831.1 ribonuclease HI [Nocardia nova]MBV7701517.1 ribonuclease HI [Nocardia nova]OBA47176.1 ribonuclease HI [Nocardia sp. 852002-20019_SCH5090214]OBA49726.1 ribonuclease HI [Nocardia sp. 852002-51101_SCH5132738]